MANARLAEVDGTHTEGEATGTSRENGEVPSMAEPLADVARGGCSRRDARAAQQHRRRGPDLRARARARAVGLLARLCKVENGRRLARAREQLDRDRCQFSPHRQGQDNTDPIFRRIDTWNQFCSTLLSCLLLLDHVLTG